MVQENNAPSVPTQMKEGDSISPNFSSEVNEDEIKRARERNKIHVFLDRKLGMGFGCFGVKKRKDLKAKENFSEQSGVSLLREHITSLADADSTKFFTAAELALATNNYDEKRIVGQGGYGTVYKGILPDLKEVAVKKSKTVDKSQVKQFINEVNMLTNINHPNVVKLLGCCLETEAPLLVYEFVAKGTLYHNLHKKSGVRMLSSLTWQDRLRIAAETAGALAYLHSAVSKSIMHRDVKSANILLDDNFTAKVADFGASRLRPLDITEKCPVVSGTFGYLDPEYFNTVQLTEKSEVYSMGVVLAELLTGEKPVSLERCEEEKGLAAYFVVSMTEGRLFKVLDAGVEDEGEMEQVRAVAELTNRCLKPKGKDRPSMEELAAELEGIRCFERNLQVQQRDKQDMSFGNKEVDLVANPSGSYSTDGSTDQYSMKQEMIVSMAFPR